MQGDENDEHTERLGTRLLLRHATTLKRLGVVHVPAPADETDRTGNGDIYVIDADGHNKVRVTNSAAGDTDPSWQPR